MVEFETLKSKEIKLGKGLLIVAAKKALTENGATVPFFGILFPHEISDFLRDPPNLVNLGSSEIS